jgi:hypothetical protein
MTPYQTIAYNEVDGFSSTCRGDRRSGTAKAGIAAGL